MKIAYFTKNNNTIYLNITNRCTNKCIYCLKYFPSNYDFLLARRKREPSKKEILKATEKAAEELKRQEKNIEEICFCGLGEPLLRFNLVEHLIPQLKKYAKVRIDTNGQVELWQKDAALKLKKAGLNKIAISINAEDCCTYNLLCKPKKIYQNFEHVLGIIPKPEIYDSIISFIKNCKKQGIETEITAVKIPKEKMPKRFRDFTPNLEEIKKLAEKMGIKFRKRNYFGPNLEEIFESRRYKKEN